MERDLDAADSRLAADTLHGFGRRMAILDATLAEKHDAKPVAPVFLREIPGAMLVEADQHLDPGPPAIKIGPLIGEPKMLSLIHISEPTRRS